MLAFEWKGSKSRFHISFFDSTGGKDAVPPPPPSFASLFLIARRSESTRALARESRDLEMVIRRKSFNSKPSNRRISSRRREGKEEEKERAHQRDESSSQSWESRKAHSPRRLLLLGEMFGSEDDGAEGCGS